jgi:hypothetical protein
VGAAIGTEAAAYPVSILEWHELVNDTLGGEPILEGYWFAWMAFHPESSVFSAGGGAEAPKPR